MKLKLGIVVLLTRCALIISMNHGGQVLEHTKQYTIDPLTAQIASQLNGVDKGISSKIIQCINKHTDKDKKTVWKNVFNDLQDFEKSQTLSRGFVAWMLGTNLADMAWLAYPAMKKINSSGDDARVCLIEPMSQVVPVVEFMNLIHFLCCLSVLFKTIEHRGGSCSTTYNKYLLDLQDHIKDKDVVTFEEIKPFIKPQDFAASTSNCFLYSNVAQLATLPDGTIDSEMFKKFLPRSYAMSDEMRRLTALTFLLNVLPSAVCAPGINANLEGGTLLSLVGLCVIWAMVNIVLGGVSAAVNFPGSSRKNHTDIRNVINTVQDHLRSERLAKQDLV